MFFQCFSQVSKNRAKVMARFVLAASFFVLPSFASHAREQYQMNHPGQWAPQAQATNYGLVPQFSPDFWQGQLQLRIPAGTVLSAILEDDLSSAKSKAGDVFALELKEGFVLNGKELIPANAKIVGSVLAATPAQQMKTGQPGRLEVSLKELVFPDGRHLALCGFIDSNPNQLYKDEPTKRNLGKNMKDYGQSVGAFLGSFTAGWGFALNRRHRGQDFELEKGEVLPVRLTRSLDMSLIAQKLVPSVPGMTLPTPNHGVHSSEQSPLLPPMSNCPSPSAPVPNVVEHKFLVPGLVGPDPDNLTPMPYVQPAPNVDPNAIFHMPLKPTPPISAQEEPF